MRILILDDEAARHAAYSEAYRQHDVFHASTYYEFISLLEKSSPWDMIHLDHDLGEYSPQDTFVDGWGRRQAFTGKHAAIKICELDDDKLPTQVIVHSVNPVGAREIKQTLDARGVASSWRPFSKGGR
jgi:hypothetical protein